MRHAGPGQEGTALEQMWKGRRCEMPSSEALCCQPWPLCRSPLFQPCCT